ncbi:unnamed protein product [Vicia faba]|uniref:RNase H type-1 domain-containing protein n=1 Tax=Vicia faba TaxID=3906 RepID=A0AAV0Z991_VICFA|nr:unnamed protein product [Vicia faba]
MERNYFEMMERDLKVIWSPLRDSKTHSHKSSAKYEHGSTNFLLAAIVTVLLFERLDIDDVAAIVIAGDGDSAAIVTCYCTLKFDGASSGNPGKSGAGVVLHSGNEVQRFGRGLSTQINNSAEYQGLILGLKEAGDSKLVCEQFVGNWKVNNPNLRDLPNEALYLKDNLKSVGVQHVSRGSNKEADAQASWGKNREDDFDSNTFRNWFIMDQNSWIKGTIVFLMYILFLRHEPVNVPNSIILSIVAVAGVKWVIRADKDRKTKFCCVQPNGSIGAKVQVIEKTKDHFFCGLALSSYLSSVYR